MSIEIGLFFGTDTGNTENVSNQIKEYIESKRPDISINVEEIYKKKPEDLDRYKYLILGMPTWYDGELQGDWEVFLPLFEEIDFTDKNIAFFGLGDQYGYSFYFCDGIKPFYDIASIGGANIVGLWPIDGYEYDSSKAEIDGKLMGLCIDVDNQDELTEGRVSQWCEQIINELNI